MQREKKMNHEGYRDPTADRAVEKFVKQSIPAPDPDAVERNRRTMAAFRAVAEAAGMDIMGRIMLKDQESGWVFK